MVQDAPHGKIGTTLLAAMLLACAGASQRHESESATREGTRERARVVLAGADAEIWSFRARVSGSVEGASAGESAREAGKGRSACSIGVGDERFAAVSEGNQFSAEVALEEGENTLRAVCSLANGRTLRSSALRYTVKLADRPTAAVQVEAGEGSVVLDGSQSAVAERSRAPIARYEWFELSTGPIPSRAALGEGARLRFANPGLQTDPQRAAAAERIYELQVTDARGRSDFARVRVAVAAGQVVAPAAEPPSWHERAVVYGVVPPLFGEPPLRSVTAAVGELAELGVSALWLSPIFTTLPDDFGYAVIDEFAVRPDYGSAEDLAQLVAAAHAHGLRVLLDLVPNHTSAEHRYFEQAQALGTRSHYFAFYERDAAGQPVHYFDWEHLPNLNYDNPEVTRWMTEVGRHWLRRFDIDGYRVDVAWGPARRDPGFFTGFNRELRRGEPEALIIAEASARDPSYVGREGFDAAYDWGEELGHWAWEGVFDAPDGIAQRLHAAVMRTAARTPSDRVFRFLNNNDTGDRFITRHGEALTRVATAALLTLPGIPCLYSFDEVGAEYRPYEQEGPIAPPDRPGLRRLHERLLAQRRDHAALHGSGFLPLRVGAPGELYAYARFADDAPADHALVALNFGSRPVTVQLPLPPSLGRARVHYRGALSGAGYAGTRGKLRVTLPAYGAEILLPEVD